MLWKKTIEALGPEKVFLDERRLSFDRNCNVTCVITVVSLVVMVILTL